MKNIHINLSFLIVTFFLGACNSIIQKQSFNQPVDNTLTLDSTVLEISVVAENLETPWEIVWGPDDWIWMTEQKGKVSRVNPQTGEKRNLLTIGDVWQLRTTGLLGMTVHPDQQNYPYVFLIYTTQRDDNHFTKLVRYTYEQDSLIAPKTLLEIPASTSHNGSRVILSEKETLFWATGDIQKDGYAQDSTSLNGKILRLTIDGEIPEDNPLPNSYVYAWGFRNMQGLVLSPDGKLYTSEHGGDIEDKVNLILPLHNYGWNNEKDILTDTSTLTPPLRLWTPIIAPAGMAYYSSDRIPEWENTLLLTTLKVESLRALKLNKDGTKIDSEKILLENIYGRLRDICISPAGDVYLSTSNRDWNPSEGFPKPTDDKILRITKGSR